VSRKSLVPIELPADPAAALEAATKQYVDARTTAVTGRWRRVANQSAASGTPLVISWDTEDDDTAGMLATPGTLVTIPSYGIWALQAMLLDQTGVVNARHMAYFQITSSLTGVTGQYRGSGYGDDNIGVSATLPLNAGDTVRVDVLQASGAAHNYQARLAVSKVA
jgi:hypothetical protein